MRGRGRRLLPPLALLATLLLVVAAWLHETAPIPPSFERVRTAFQPSYARLLDRDGHVIHELRTDPTRRRLGWTPLAEVSPALVAAVIAAEDRRFASHGGVDARALAAAAAQRLGGGPPRGASTLSMQVAGLVDPRLAARGGRRTLAQKWRQMRLAWALERAWGKPRLLEAYLNLVTFRGELQGVAAASAVLLGAAPHGVTPAEGAVLAVLLRAPAAAPDAVARRARRLAAARGLDARADAVDDAVARALQAPAGLRPGPALAPHVAQRLLGGARAGVSVRSTLDGDLQEAAAEILRRQLLALHGRHVQDGAVLVVDNATGEVRAYVGGSAELSSARFVDGVVARRQAGSTLKPFLYGLALDRRILTAASLLDDAPLEVAVAGGLYRPRNYDERFRGPVTVRAALAGSLNVPAVRALGLVGGDELLGALRGLGLARLDEDGEFYGPALALGGADASLWELVGAYRALAAGGVWRPLRLRPRLSPEDEATAGASRRVYSPAAAWIVADILADRESRSATFGLDSPLATRFWAAVKTGTSRDMRDNWCVGFSRRYTVGVWVGNFAGAPMRDVSGVSGAAPVWRELMERLHRDRPSPAPAPPAELVAPPGGGRAEWFLAGTAPAAGDGAHGVAAPVAARIVAPVARAIVAVDPDVPPARQRMAFEAAGAVGGLRWRLGVDDLGPAATLVLWPPRPGRHALALVDAEGRVVDRVVFLVRGAAAPPEPAPD